MKIMKIIGGRWTLNLDICSSGLSNDEPFYCLIQHFEFFHFGPFHEARHTHVTGTFADLRPPVGTYDLRSYGGEHQKVEADRRLSPNWHFLCTELAQRVRKWVTCVTSEKGPTLGTLESAGPIPRGPPHM